MSFEFKVRARLVLEHDFVDSGDRSRPLLAGHRQHGGSDNLLKAGFDLCSK